MAKAAVANDTIADEFDHVADLLSVTEANAYRIQSYHRAARTLRQMKQPVSKILQKQGRRALEELPGIGKGLAGSIEEIVTTGRLGLRETLESQVSPIDVLTQVPGIGRELAERIHDKLGIASLEELEIAAHDGRLEKLEGIGPVRAEGVRVALTGLLSRSARRKMRQAAGALKTPPPPPVDLILDLDEEYLEKANIDKLPKIAPKRFNPDREAWLPILKTKREDWKFTLLFSNTANARQRGRTRDWVVVYYERRGIQDQCTVVTAESGPLKDKRVIRGRELECRRYYGL